MTHIAIAGLGVIALGLSSCDRTPTTNAEVQGSATAAANLFEACVAADNRVSEIMHAALVDAKGTSPASNPQFLDRLQAMVDACRPILPAFTTDQIDPSRAALAKLCQDGYRLKIDAYQDFINGVADDRTAKSLIEGAIASNKCDEEANRLSKEPDAG